MEIIEKIRKCVKSQMEIYWKKLPDADDENPTQIQLRDLGQYMAYENMEIFLDSLQEETPEPYTGKYDEAYLQEKIAKATKSWEGVDVDKFMDEVRGRETPDDLEEAAETHVKNKYNLTKLLGAEIREAVNDFIAGAEWQKNQMLKDAVEGKIYGYGDGSFELVASWLDMPENPIYKDGDKVRIVVLKEEE